MILELSLSMPVILNLTKNHLNLKKIDCHRARVLEEETSLSRLHSTSKLLSSIKNQDVIEKRSDSILNNPRIDLHQRDQARQTNHPEVEVRYVARKNNQRKDLKPLWGPN
jgi:hypothetical protein